MVLTTLFERNAMPLPKVAPIFYATSLKAETSSLWIIHKIRSLTLLEEFKTSPSLTFKPRSRFEMSTFKMTIAMTP